MLGEPTIADSAKQRSLRVPLDYVRQTDRMGRRKLRLVVAMGVAALAYVIWLAVGGRAAKKHLSPGPLARAHAAFSDDCQACHQEFQPLRADAVDLFAALTTSIERRETMTAACLRCHQTPRHHALVNDDQELSCAACHHEHQGSLAELTRVRDNQCVGCHRDLTQLAAAEASDDKPYANVVGFAGANGDQPKHPEFRSLQAGDPGNISFNHWLHMQPGIAAKDARQPLHVDRVAAYVSANVGRVSWDQAGGIQLSCSACHEPDGDGRRMRPIAYEQHCKDCHPLSASLGEGEPAVIPHGLPAMRLAAVLDGLLLARQRRGSQPSAEAATQSGADESGDLPLIPGRTLGNNLAQKIQRDLLGRRGALAAAVDAKCLQCHEVSKPADGSDRLLPELRASSIPNPWFVHARFDHGAHRQVDCRQCHAAAFTFEKRDEPRFVNAVSGALAARDNDEVMIAGM